MASTKTHNSDSDHSTSAADFFSSLSIDESSCLETEGRTFCPTCNKSCKYYCPYCAIAVVAMEHLPIIKLPVRIDIIKHPNEYHGKSTACHGAILAPDWVRVHRYPVVPEYDVTKTLLLYPSKDAHSLRYWLQEHAAEGCNSAASLSSCNLWFDTLVVIDSSWNQANSVAMDSRLKGLRRVQLMEHVTHFWRFQKGAPRTHLSTIECIYWACREIQELLASDEAAGCDVGTPGSTHLDNLLFYFRHQHTRLADMHAQGRASFQAFKHRRNYRQPVLSVAAAESTAPVIDAASLTPAPAPAPDTGL